MPQSSNQQEWRPWPKQEFALRQKCYETLYGGARGPGKTECGIIWMLKCVDHPRFRGLVIRRNADDLKDWVDRAEWLYSGYKPEFVGKPTEIRFPSGAKIYTGHLNDANAYNKYLGHEYQRILIEELTQISREEDYQRLLGSCRSTIPEIDPRIFCTTNPLNVGHKWVKKRFVDPEEPMVKFIGEDTGRTRMFIPGTVYDNPTLIDNDPDYLKYLEGLPEDLKQAWLYGSWDHMAGMYFDEFKRGVHVYRPSEVEILDSWPKFRTVDWGFRDPMAVYWHAVGPDQHIYTYRELYVTEMHDEDVAKLVIEMTAGERIDYTVGDPASFPVKIPVHKFGQLTSMSRAEIWAENGVPMIMGINDRIMGWTRMRQYLKIRDGKSWWHISSECKNLLEEIEGAIHSEKGKPEDIDSRCVDHALDSCRLGLMSRPPVWFEKENKIKSHLQAAERQAEREELRNDDLW